MCTWILWWHRHTASCDMFRRAAFVRGSDRSSGDLVESGEISSASEPAHCAAGSAAIARVTKKPRKWWSRAVALKIWKWWSRVKWVKQVNWELLVVSGRFLDWYFGLDDEKGSNGIQRYPTVTVTDFFYQFGWVGWVVGTLPIVGCLVLSFSPWWCLSPAATKVQPLLWWARASCAGGVGNHQIAGALAESRWLSLWMNTTPL